MYEIIWSYIVQYKHNVLCMCQLLTWICFRTPLCKGRYKWLKKEEVNKRTNKVISLPLPPVDPCPLAFVPVSLPPASPYVPRPPTPHPERNSQAAGTSQPPQHHPNLPLQPRELWGGGPPKQRALLGGVIPPIVPDTLRFIWDCEKNRTQPIHCDCT